jgi:hypothetical protein
MKLKETVILFKFKLSTKMKKLFLSLAVVSMSVSFFACGGATEEKKGEDAAKNDSPKVEDTTTTTDTIIENDTLTNGQDTLTVTDTTVVKG